MTRPILAAVVALLPLAAAAQTYDAAECDRQARLVMTGVEARGRGADIATTRRVLSQDLPEDVAEMLADWIHSLPAELVGDAVGEAWRRQCEAA
jgi:hypothetical protein